MNDRRGKSLLWASLAAAIVAAQALPMRAQGQPDDRAWVNELQPGRKRTRSNNEAQWKREQRSSKRKNK